MKTFLRGVFFFIWKIVYFSSSLKERDMPKQFKWGTYFLTYLLYKKQKQKKTIFAKISTGTFLCIFYTSVSRFGKTVLASWIWRTGIPKTGILKSKKIQTLQSAERKKWINLP